MVAQVLAPGLPTHRIQTPLGSITRVKEQLRVPSGLERCGRSDSGTMLSGLRVSLGQCAASLRSGMNAFIDSGRCIIRSKAAQFYEQRHAEWK